jgi:hypothetical protein
MPPYQIALPVPQPPQPDFTSQDFTAQAEFVAGVPASPTGPGSFSPQPTKNPVATGTPKEGPQSALVFLVIPAGEMQGNLSTNIEQFGMSMVQSLLVDNEANATSITVKAGTQAVNFGIQALGTQIIPVFQTGTTLNINIKLPEAVAFDVSLAFQIFNFEVPPASWVANLAVSGNVNIANVGGAVNVNVQNSNLIGVGLAAEVTGGANSKLMTGLSNTVTTVKTASGVGTFKGFSGLSAAAGWLQFFDASTAGSVTPGTTAPTWTFPVLAGAIAVSSNLPPEGLAFTKGLQAAWTTTATGGIAPAAAWQGNIFYA